MRLQGIFLILISLLVATELDAAVFTGKITDENGQPIPYASVYIHELSTGVSTDEKGEFRITLQQGTYTCEVSSLGYKRERFTVEVNSQLVTKTIILKEEIYRLSDVTFRGGKEDRAMSVMRKAIAKAPFHRQQVRGYESTLYMKGSMKVTKIPALIRLQAGRSRTGLVLNKLFLIESHSEIVYSYPNNYDETVKAVSSTIPSEINPGNMSGVIRTSVYDKNFFGKLSPLAPNAFNYYKFVYEGITNESGRIINKIRVTPKKGDAKLITGHIYIQDDVWNVSYIDFVTKEAGVTTNIKITYNEVKPSIMLPTAYSADVKVDVLGVNAGGRFNSSITYSKVNEVKGAPVQPEPLPADKEITTREAKTIASATEKRVKQNDTTSRKKDLEIKRDTTHKRVVDTLAKMRDNTYWAEVRRLPLSEEEILSYKMSDSLKKEFKRVFEEDSVKRINRSTGNKVLDKIVYDARYKVGKNITLGYGGLSRLVGDFNFTDGYQIGQNLFASYRINNNSSVVLTPEFYYSTLRKELLWKTDAVYTYSPLRSGRLFLSIGEGSSNISRRSGVSPLVNSYAAFLFGLNPVKFHSRRWVESTNSIDISNGLRLNVGLSYEEITPLENGGAKSLFGKVPQPNNPDNIYEVISTEHKSASYTISLSYTPEYYFRIRDGKKRYVRSKYPTFTLYSRATFAAPSQEYSSYGMAGLTISQRFNSGLYGMYLYNIDAGGFYKRDRVFLKDFRHFASSDIMVTENGFNGAFLLLDSYRYSTPESWLTAAIEYRTDYLLLNRLPIFNSALLYEALHLKTLWLPEKRITHTEAGYSFGMKGLARAGIFVGFDGVKYNGYGFRIELPILSQLR
ncbi:MAG: DUF5686 and carboxypeptidase regulatory-like domain-containing protein [Bacteroidales bacterium]|nr:DUF5686 and carboxypeptidase regulatory-like domain-containing protein [Bacteroidales bacterium]